MDWDVLIFKTVGGIVFLLGLRFGSFLNVVVYRLPAGVSLLYPPSRCPKCGHELGARENVPVLGWLWLRGKCRWCKTAIALRYPMVEATLALLWLVAFLKFGIDLQTIAAAVFLFWLLALALIDLDTFRLPNVLTQSGLVMGLLFQGAIGWQAHGLSGMSQALMGAIAAGVLGIWLFEAIAFLGTLLLGQPAMGGGDAKLAAMMGVWLGWQQLLLAGLLACAIGSVVMGSAIALGKHRIKQQLPFGPFLALSAVISLFWGQEFIQLYLQKMGLA